MDQPFDQVQSSGDFAAQPAAEGSPGFSGRVPAILIVDSDSEVAMPLVHALTDLGYRVMRASSAGQAAEILRGPIQIDLAIVDYFASSTDGRALLGDIAAHGCLQRPGVVVASEWLDEFHPAWVAHRKSLPPKADALIAAYVSRPYRLAGLDGFLRLLLGVPRPASSKLDEALTAEDVQTRDRR